MVLPQFQIYIFKYHPILPCRPQLLQQYLPVYIISKEKPMKQTISVETQLNCKATAELRKELATDLSMPDKPISELLVDSEDKDESKNNDRSSD